MLILTRNAGESIRISDEVTITVVGSKPSGIAIGVDAPLDVSILREEARIRKPAVDEELRKQR